MNEQQPMTPAERDEAMRKVDAMLQSRLQRVAIGLLWDLVANKIQPLHGTYRSGAQHAFMTKGAVDAALVEWRALFHEVPEFDGANYAFTVSGNIVEQVVNVTPSSGLMALMQGAAPVRMPVPPITDDELRKLVSEVDLYAQSIQEIASEFEAIGLKTRGTIH